MKKKKLEEFCGLVLGDGEKQRLYELCIKHNIPIHYERLFKDNVDHYLWGISYHGIGLVGTIVMHDLSKKKKTIFHSLDELENYLENDEE